MKKLNLQRTILSSSIAAVIGSLSSGVVFAQGAEVEEEVVVTGIRGSLERAMDIKREASGVVDAISAEDIGKFPDTNLAESLQRISGVSIDRSNNEGNQVSVRGLGPEFNLVTLNGRQMPSAAVDVNGNANRSFNFANLASESIAGVDIYKTGKADHAGGGIGAVIDIKTAKPLNLDPLVATVGVKAIHDTSNELGDDITPELSGMISSNFADGMFGVLASFSYQVRHNREERVSIDGWLPNQHGDAPVVNADINQHPDDVIWMPRNLNIGVDDHERERLNAGLVFQFAPTDDVTVTADYFYTDFEDTITRQQLGVWFNGGSANVVDPTNPDHGDYDGYNGVTINENGTIVDIAEIGVGGSTDFFNYYDTIKTEHSSFGLNVDWQVTDNLNLVFDAHSSKADAQPGKEENNRFVIAGMFNGKRLNIQGSDDLPTLTIDESNPDVDWMDAGQVGTNLFRRGYNTNTAEITEFNISGAWDNESDSALQTIKFGVGRSKYENKNAQAHNQCCWWVGGYGQESADRLDDSLFTWVDAGSDFMDGFSGSVPSAWFHFDARAVERAEEATNHEIPFSGGATVYPGRFEELIALQADHRLEEETTHFFFSMDWDTEFNGMPFRANTGFRFENTDVTGQSLDFVLEELGWQSQTELSRHFADEQSFTNIEANYKSFLPNLDASLEVIDDLIVRAAYSKTQAKPRLNDMRSAISYETTKTNGEFKANRGNPELLPYTADNFDLSVEWYYGDGSYASIGYFYKVVNDYITIGQAEEDINGVTDPSQDADCNNLDFTAPGAPNSRGDEDNCVAIFSISTPQNNETAVIDGFELAVQHMFGESGFGVQANYTDVESDVEFDVLNIDQQFAVPGLSDSANLVAFYENFGFSGRLAYNWRDDFLLNIGQIQISTEPTFVEEYGQWDLSLGYNITESFSVQFEALNITGENLRQYGRYEEQLLRAIAQEPRYALGARYTF